MSRFLLLNFKDFGLNQDITQTIQSHSLFCMCCLDKSVPLINICSCKHAEYLENFPLPKVEMSKNVICLKCHSILKKIYHFKQQVQDSLKILVNQTINLNDDDNLKTLILEVKKTVDIYLPPVKYIPDHNDDKCYELKVKCREKEANMKHFNEEKPGLPFVEIKAENMEYNIPTDLMDTKGNENTTAKKSKVKIITLTREEVLNERIKEAQSPAYLKYPFRCENCIIGFKYEENIKDHISRKHGPKVGSVTCDICLSVLHPPGAMTAHYYRHVTRYECVDCGKRYTSHNDTLTHYNRTHVLSEPLYRCKVCNYTTEIYHRFNYHRLKHKKKHSCAHCGMVLANQYSLKQHMSKIHKKKYYNCIYCDCMCEYADSFAEHMQTHGADAGRAYCRPCRLQFSTWHAYNSHMKRGRNHFTTTELQCSECNVKFTVRTPLVIPNGSVQQKSLQKCQKCDLVVKKPEKKNSYVNLHQKRSHNIFVCAYCEKQYQNRKLLIQHIHSHAKLK